MRAPHAELASSARIPTPEPSPIPQQARSFFSLQAESPTFVNTIRVEEHILNQQELTELQWYTPQNLLVGTYFLRVQADEEVQQ